MAVAENIDSTDNTGKNVGDTGGSSTARTRHCSSSSSPSDDGNKLQQLPNPQPAGYKNKRHTCNLDNLKIPPSAASTTFGPSNPTSPHIGNGQQWNYVDQPASLPYMALPPPTPAAAHQQYIAAMAWRAAIATMVQTPTTVTFPQQLGSHAYFQHQPLLTTPGWQTPRAGGLPAGFFSLPSAAPTFPPYGFPAGNGNGSGPPSPYNMSHMAAALPFQHLVSSMPPTPAPMIQPPYNMVSNFGFGGAANNYNGIGGYQHPAATAALDAMRQQVVEAMTKSGGSPNTRWSSGANGGLRTGPTHQSPLAANGNVAVKEPRFESRRDGTSVAYVDVDTRELAAEVVGKKGKNIKSIEQVTECKIQAPVHEDGSIVSNSSSLAFTIIGDKVQVKQAVVELRQRIELVKSIQHDRSNRARPSHGQIVRHLAVPARLVSFIVGHQGQEINRVADRCSCYVLSPKEDRDAIFHIVGTEPNTRACVQRICDFIWKREQQSLYTLLQNETWRRECPENPDYQKSPSECRKLCGYIFLGSGTELLSGIEMRTPRFGGVVGPMMNGGAQLGAPLMPVMNHPDLRLGNLGTGSDDADDEHTSSGYSGTGDNSEADGVSPPEMCNHGDVQNSATAGVQVNGNGFLPPTYADGSTLTSPVGTRSSSLSGSVVVENGEDGSPHGAGGARNGSNCRVTSAQPTPLHALGEPSINGMPLSAGVGISPVRPSFAPVLVCQPSYPAAAAANYNTESLDEIVSPADSPTTPSYRTVNQKQQFQPQQQQQQQQQYNCGYRGFVTIGDCGAGGHVTNGNAQYHVQAQTSAYARGGGNISFGGGSNNRMFRSQPGPQNH